MSNKLQNYFNACRDVRVLRVQYHEKSAYFECMFHTNWPHTDWYYTKGGDVVDENLVGPQISYDSCICASYKNGQRCNRTQCPNHDWNKNFNDLQLKLDVARIRRRAAFRELLNIGSKQGK